MSNVADNLVTDAVLVALAAAFPNTPVGDGEKPAGATEQAGYFVVHPVPSGDRTEGSPISGRYRGIVWLRYQILAEGVQRNQVEKMAADSASAFLARDSAGAFTLPITVANHAVMNRRHAGQIPLDTLGTWQSGWLLDLHVTIA